MKKVWNKWLRLAEIIGTVQMVIILSLVYWTLLAVMAIPFRIFADPLALRDPERARWVQYEPADDFLSGMKKQG